MDVNPIPAFGTQNDVSRTLTKYAVVLKLPTLITSAITGSNPVTPGFVQVLTHYFTSFIISSSWAISLLNGSSTSSLSLNG
jgi:hypothetical protein